uniref:Uncharacterized protein n=1 Tax=Anguilla anguilla TaxID=7936 RepID=A0A0E9V7A1_ANGAN
MGSFCASRTNFSSLRSQTQRCCRRAFERLLK